MESHTSESFPEITEATNQIDELRKNADLIKKDSKKINKKLFTSILFKIVVTLLLLLITFAVGLIIAYQKQIRNKVKPQNFNECIMSKGSVVRESYPRVCVTKDGQEFIENIRIDDSSLLESEIKLREVKASTESAIVKGSCKVGGCNNEICMSETDKGVVSICIYKPEYECYRKAICEKQANNKCGWTQTKSLRECIENTSGSTNSAQ